MNPFGFAGWPALVWLPSKLYGAAARARQKAYARGYAETVRLPVPVFCVGNLTVGGSGKTPVTLWLAEYLKNQGRRPAILSRGYGRAARGPVFVANQGEVLPPSAEIGDEPRLMAQRLPGVPVAVEADRALAGRRALEAWGSGCLVMDDGFQHHRLFRDRNILCLDARLAHAVLVQKKPARLLPAGPWREGLDGMARAHVIVLTRVDWLEDSARLALEEALGARPTAWAGYQVSFLGPEGAPLDREALRGKNVAALSGLADPASFEESLAAAGAKVIPVRHGDHHPFTEQDLARAQKTAGPGGLIVTTEKDRQRLPADFPAATARLDLVWEDTAWTSVIDSAFV